MGCDADVQIGTIRTNVGSKAAAKGLKVVEAVPVEDVEQEGTTGWSTVARQSSEEMASVDVKSIASMLEKCLQFQNDFADGTKQRKQERRWWQLQVQVQNLRDDLEMI